MSTRSLFDKLKGAADPPTAPPKPAPAAPAAPAKSARRTPLDQSSLYLPPNLTDRLEEIAAARRRETSAFTGRKMRRHDVILEALALYLSQYGDRMHDYYPEMPADYEPSPLVETLKKD